MPGLRAGLARYRRRFGSRKTLAADLRAGLVLGTESVPDGLAAGLLAGVNPVHGLYAYLAGTLGGALATGSVFMTVQTTGAMAVIVSDVPLTQDPATSADALAVLALLTGLIMISLGLAGLGSMVRFIPTAVLAGFVNAVAVNIVLGQLDNVTGYAANGDNRVLRALDTLAHIPRFSLATFVVAAMTAALALALERTRLGALGMVVAVLVASLVPFAIPSLDVATIADTVTIPSALPSLAVPDLGLVLSLVIPALALSLVGLVQGAGISASTPNPDGQYPDASSDFRGQGVANLVAGAVQGMPVGGSMSATALVKEAGARTAAANLIAAVVMAVTIIFAAPLIAHTAMPALGTLLVLVGVRTIKPSQLALVWRTGSIQATVLVVTFTLTLLIPLQYAVLAGVGLAVVLHVARQSNRIKLRSWTFDQPDALPRESDPPSQISAGDIVILVPYGSLFFAAAPRLEEQLPQPTGDAADAYVILRLRGSDELGSTAIGLIVNYAERLRGAGATLILAGVGSRVIDQLAATGALDEIGEANVFAATDRLGDSLKAALASAQRRLGQSNA